MNKVIVFVLVAPMDQPERLLDMITTFVNGHTFATKE